MKHSILNNFSRQFEKYNIKKQFNDSLRGLAYSHHHTCLNAGLNFHNLSMVGLLGRKSWDVEDDFSSYADQTAFDAVWVPSGSTIKGNPTTDVIDFNTEGVQVCYRDLTSISDTTWISRFKITLTTTGVNLGILWVCMSDNTSNAQTAQDFLALMIYDNDNNFNISGDPARRPDQSLTQTALSPQISPSNTTYYCELKRTSATSFTATVYSDSGYTTSLGTQTITVDSAINNLRYVKLLGYTSGAMIGTFDDIKIMKTQSTPP